MTGEKPSLGDLRIEESVRRGGGRRLAWSAVAVLLLAGAVAGWWFFARAAAAVVRISTVVEKTAADGRVGGGAVLNGSGYVTARRRATVSSKITGKVKEVFVEEGMALREGQVVARLDDTTARAYLRVAEAEVLAARRTLDETEVRLKEARTTLARAKSLTADGIMQQADLDAAVAAADAFDARLTAAREQVSVAEAQLGVRRTDLDDTTIRAPFTGVAVSKDAQPGEMISPVSAGGGFTRTGICTLVDMTSLEIEVDVNESYIGRVTPGQKVEATLDAYPEWKIPAHVITPVPTADRQKATVLVRIAFERLDPRILPDMGIKVAFLGDPQARADRAAVRKRLLVPREAVRGTGGEEFLFLYRDGSAVKRPVQLGSAEGNEIEVQSGISAGDRVIVEGSSTLADGVKVVVRGG